MANIAPILRIRGKVRQTTPRTVPAVLARDEVRDPESGAVTTTAREARPEYDVVDVVLDTDPGGLVDFVITPGAAEATSGWLPTVGDVVDVPVRGYTNWKGSPGRRYATNGYSLAGDVFATELGAESGRRISAAS